MAGSSADGPQLVRDLQRAWRNEHAAPELLDFQRTLVDNVKRRIEQQESMLDELQDSGEDLMIKMLEMELHRIRFVLRSYHRCRLQKLERYPIHTLSDDVVASRLLPQEEEYLARFVDATERLFQRSFLSSIPESYRSIIREEMIEKPNLNTFVVLQINSTVGEFETTPGVVVNLEEGDILIAVYKPFRGLLRKHQVSLI